MVANYEARGACAFAEIAFTDFGNRCELGIIKTHKRGLLVQSVEHSIRIREVTSAILVQSTKLCNIF